MTIVPTPNGLEAQTAFNSQAIPAMITIGLVCLGALASVLRIFVNKLWMRISALTLVSIAAVAFMSLDLNMAFSFSMREFIPVAKGFKIADAVCGVFGVIVILDAVAAFVLELMPIKKKC